MSDEGESARTSPSASPGELLNRLSARAEGRKDSAAFSLDDLSTMAMLDSLGQSYEILHARFTGSLPSSHSIGLREATSVLGALQEVVSEVGASLRQESPKRGPLPAGILMETELQLSPHVAPGSVVFAISPGRDVALFENSTLLEEALEQVLQVFDRVERPISAGGTPETVADSLRRFGPRTARHLVRFADALSSYSLNLDLGIAASGRKLTGARISKSGAAFLGSLAKEATKRTTEITVTGEVHSLGKDHRYKINTLDRGRIQVAGSSDVTDVLQVAFRQSPVKLSLLETEAINVATGASKFTFEAVSAELSS